MKKMVLFLALFAVVLFSNAENNFENMSSKWIESDSITTTNLDNISYKEHVPSSAITGGIIIICLLFIVLVIYIVKLSNTNPPGQIRQTKKYKNVEIPKDNKDETIIDSNTEEVFDFEEEKAGCMGIGFSFVFPFIGIVLYFYQKDSVSNPSTYLFAAIIGFICGVIINGLLSLLV